MTSFGYTDMMVQDRWLLCFFIFKEEDKARLCASRVIANWWLALMQIKFADVPYNHSFFKVIETFLFYSRAISDIVTRYFFLLISRSQQNQLKLVKHCVQVRAPWCPPHRVSFYVVKLANHMSEYSHPWVEHYLGIICFY